MAKLFRLNIFRRRKPSDELIYATFFNSERWSRFNQLLLSTSQQTSRGCGVHNNEIRVTARCNNTHCAILILTSFDAFVVYSCKAVLLVVIKNINSCCSTLRNFAYFKLHVVFYKQVLISISPFLNNQKCGWSNFLNN